MRGSRGRSVLVAGGLGVAGFGPAAFAAPVGVAPVAGAPPQAVTVDPSALRVLRLPGIDAEPTPGGDQSPAVAAGLFLTLPGAALHLDRIDELRAPIPSAEARAYAGLVASSAPLAGTLSVTEVALAVTTGPHSAPLCHHAQMERFTLQLAGSGAVLTGQRPIPGSENDTPGACPATSGPVR